MRGGSAPENPQRFKVQVRLKVVREKDTFKRPKDLDAWRISTRKPTTLQGAGTIEGCEGKRHLQASEGP